MNESIKQKSKKVELLSPAGDLQSFYAAINCGADAVYLGMTGFNAREKAENFNENNIFDVVNYAHLFGAKIYVTLNTLVCDNEFEDVYKLVSKCVEAKVDAFIVQDFGVVKFLQDNFVDIEIHASTQMGIHNLYGALIAEKLGIKRVVLSRETTLEDIKQIKENTNLEIEYFIQGALCVAFSGNCYLSSILLGESGNRGKCKQLCRLQYGAFENEKNIKNGCLLSSKDLCLIDNLKQLIDAGVCSFKIEGRLRRPGYVAGTTAIYKNLIEKILANNITQNDIIDDEQKLKMLFSRGEFNKNAYLYENKNNIINPINQNHTGIKIGKVLKVTQFKDLYKIVFSSSVNISKGDGLKFFENTKEIASLGVGNVNVLSRNSYEIFSKNCPNVDCDVHLTLNNKLEQDYLCTKRKLKINVKVEAQENKILFATAKCGSIEAQIESDFILEKAKNQNDVKQQIFEQFSKVGDTHFEIENIDIKCDDVFLAKSMSNAIRRKLYKLLEEKIIYNNQNNKTKIKNNIINNKINNNNCFLLENIKNIYLINDFNIINNKIINKNDNLIIYCPNIYSKDNFNNFKNYVNNNYNLCSYGLYLPVIANAKDICIIDDILNDENCYVVANNIWGLAYIKNNKVIAGIGLNMFNKKSCEVLKNLGVKAVAKSVEKICDLNCDAYEYQGALPLMTLCHCPYSVVYNNDCSKCSYNNKLFYKMESGKEFDIRRIKIAKCYFSLVSKNQVENNAENKMIDLRV